MTYGKMTMTKNNTVNSYNYNYWENSYFGQCFINIAPERFPRENIVDITIDKFLEKYLSTDHQY